MNRYEKNGPPIILLVVIAIIFIVLGYFVGGVFKLGKFSFLTLGDNLIYVITHPFQNWFNPKTFACMGLGLVAALLISSYVLTRYRNVQRYQYGNREFEDPVRLSAEMADPDEKYNRILSDSMRVSLRTNALPNNNLLVIGSSGTFKTTTLVEQNILQFGSTYIMLDVKGSTQEKLGNKIVSRPDYQLKSINLKDPLKSDQYNPFLFIETDKDLKNVCEALFNAVYTMANQKDSSVSQDPFWPQCCKMFLQSIFYHVWYESQETGKIGTLNDILILVNEENQLVEPGNPKNKMSVLGKKMEVLRDKHGPFYPPVRDYLKMPEPGKTRDSVMSMVNSMLTPLEFPEIKRIFSGNDISFRELGCGVNGDPEKKTVLFIVTPDGNHDFDFVVAMFYTQLFDQLKRIADMECKGALPIPVEVWMDEFYAGSKPADVLELMGLVRSRNISMIPILQDVSQLKDLYGSEQWDIITSNTGALIFLGCGPGAFNTMKYISDLVGETTVDTRSENIGQSNGVSFGSGSMKLATPEDIGNMPLTDCIIFMQSRNPVYDQKAFPFDVPVHGVKGNPALKARYKEATSFGPYEHPVEVAFDEEKREYITVHDSALPYFKLIKTEEDLAIFRERAKKDPRILVQHLNDEHELFLVGSNKTSPKELSAKLDAILTERELIEKRFSESVGAVAFDEDMTQEELFNNFYYNVTPHKDWTKQPTLQDSLREYASSMSMFEKERLAILLNADVDEETINNFIYMSFSQQNALLKAARC